jgi:stage III sporulation protein SpoIIIAA
MEDISAISLDLGRRPHCWCRQRRVFFNEDHCSTVQDDDIQCIIDRLEDIGSDNRSGIDKQLHRISCIRNNKKNIIGLTIRVGRHVEGNADIIRDLPRQNEVSILFLGEVSEKIRFIKYTLPRDAYIFSLARIR